MDTIDSRIEAAKQKLKQLTAQKQQIEARKRAAESKRKRTDDTRRKILIGAAILAKVDRGEWPRSRLLAMMHLVLTRPDDRALFDLPDRAADPVVPMAAFETPESAPAAPPGPADAPAT
jgi:hypothetical protein